MRRPSSQRASVSTSTPWPFVGQQALGSRLLTAFQRGQLPAAILFAGPAHMGKSTAALWLTQYDYCQSDTPRPCGHCSPCHQIANRSHPAVVVLDSNDQEHISVEQIRQALGAFHYRTNADHHQWLLLLEAQSLTEGAANALLKFLEEPPAMTTILLTSSQYASLPTTILSRLALYFWPFVSNDHLRQWLTKNAQSPEATNRLVARAAGRPGLLLDKSTATADQSIETWLTSLEQAQSPYSEQEIRSLTTAETREILERWQLGWREIMLHQLQATKRLLWPSWSDRFVSLARKFSITTSVNMLDRLERGQLHLHQNVAPRQIIHDLYVAT